MTEQEFYIWLLNCDSSSKTNLPQFNPGFLKNYEIAKLILDKTGIKYLNEIQQKNLNLEAVSAWFSVSGFIKLVYDTPEILELLPERIIGDLSLGDSLIQSLPQLKSVGGDLYLRNSKIESLPELKSVGGKISVSEDRKYYWRNHFTKAGKIDLAAKVI